MEEILASIKRIIAEDGEMGGRANVRQGSRQEAGAPPEQHPLADPVPTPEDPVLELTDPVSFGAGRQEPEKGTAAANQDGLISEISVQASRHALDALSKAVVHTPGTTASASALTLDSLVIELLRPMLKQWLDQHLPEIVETMVQREIARITGKNI